MADENDQDARARNEQARQDQAKADQATRDQDQAAARPRRGNDRRPPSDPASRTRAAAADKQPDPTRDAVAAGRVPKPATNLTQHRRGSGLSGTDDVVDEPMPDPPRTTMDGLRLDGPSFDKWVEDGNDPNEYPPPSYADRRIVNDDGLRTDGPTYEAWTSSGKLAVDYPPPGFAARHDGEDAGEFMTDEQVNDARARGEWPGRGAVRSRERSTVEASAGAVDPPAPGVVRTAAAGGVMGTAASQTGAVGAFPARDPATGLRTDGPSYDEYVAAGFDGRSYPPQGYTDKRQAAGQWPANAARAGQGGQGDIGAGRADQAGGSASGTVTQQPGATQQPGTAQDAAQASSVLPSGTEAVDYGRGETDEERQAREARERDNPSGS